MPLPLPPRAAPLAVPAAALAVPGAALVGEALAVGAAEAVGGAVPLRLLMGEGLSEYDAEAGAEGLGAPGAVGCVLLEAPSLPEGGGEPLGGAALALPRAEAEARGEAEPLSQPVASAVGCEEPLLESVFEAQAVAEALPLREGEGL